MEENYTKDLQKLLDEFLQSCLKSYESQEIGNSKIANKQFYIIKKIINKLKNNPDYGLDKLIPLLEYHHPYVQMITASKLLFIDEEKAKSVLREVEKLKGNDWGLTAFEAKMTLQEWEKGNMKWIE